MAGLERELLQLLDVVYDAAFDSARWQGVLDRAAAILDAKGGRLSFMDPRAGQQRLLALGGMDPDQHERFVSERPREDLWALRALQRLDADPSVRTATGAELLPPDELRRAPFYHEMLVPFGILDTVMTAVGISKGSVGGFALWRSPSVGLFQRADRELFDSIGRHVSRALRLGFLVAQGAEREAAILQRLPCAAFLCDESGRVRLHNEAADELLRRRDGVALRSGRLRAVRSCDHGSLERAIAEAARSAMGADATGGATLRLRRAAGGRDLVAHVEPVREAGPASDLFVGGLATPSALVLVSDPDCRAILPEEALARAFRLTPTESRLLSFLCAGGLLVEYAERNEITRETARFHLKQLFAKTGTRRQSALIRVALESAVRFGSAVKTERPD